MAVHPMREVVEEVPLSSGRVYIVYLWKVTTWDPLQLLEDET